MQLPKATLPSRAMSGSMVSLTVARDSVDVHGMCYHQGPCKCPWSVLLLRVVMVSVACSAAECCVDVCVLYCHGRPC